MLDIGEISVKLPHKSTVIFPNAPNTNSGHSTGMDLGIVLRNIDIRLRVLRLTDNAASLQAGKPDAIRNMRRKLASGSQGGINANTLAALARVLETTPAALMDRGQAIPPVDGAEIPQMRAYLLAQRELIERQLEALDAVEQPQKRARSKSR